MDKRLVARVMCSLLVSLFVFASASVSRAEDEDFKRFGVRVGAMYIIPDEHFGQNFRTLTEPLVGKTTIETALSPEVNLEYFFTRCISSELVLTVSKHDVMFGNGSVNAGSLWLLPPSLFLKYHPFPTAVVSPYVGFGMNVVIPFDEKITILGVRHDFSVSTSVGWAAKMGFDIPIYKCKCFNLYYNVDAMYYSTETDMTIGGLGKFDVDINPWIISSGIAFRF